MLVFLLQLCCFSLSNDTHEFEAVYCVLTSATIHHTHTFVTWVSYTLYCLNVPPSYCNKCPTVLQDQLSYHLTVLLSYCLTVLLSYCPTVLMYHCPTVLLSCCLTVLLSHCLTVLLSYCPTVLLSYCTTVPLSYCPTVLVSFLLHYIITSHTVWHLYKYKYILWHHLDPCSMCNNPRVQR